MKPTDLKPPSISESTAHLCDGVFFLPRKGGERGDFEWKEASIELCSGNGDWIVERALSSPQCRFVAVEKRFDRVRKIWSKMRNRRLDNLLIVCGEACRFVEEYVPSGGVVDVFINFPDPWPKRKHAKHRLMQPRFLDALARVMCGTLTFVTDDAAYLEQTCALLEAHPDFQGGVVERLPPNYGSSYFEILWREKGKEIWYATYAKQLAQNRVGI